MVVVPLSQSATDAGMQRPSPSQPVRKFVASLAEESQRSNWVRMAAVGSLAFSGVLLMSGRRRAGLIAAVSGTALVMLDQQESVKTWWAALPVYLEEAQLLLNRAQGAVEDIGAQREKLHRIFNK